MVREQVETIRPKQQVLEALAGFYDRKGFLFDNGPAGAGPSKGSTKEGQRFMALVFKREAKVFSRDLGANGAPEILRGIGEEADCFSIGRKKPTAPRPEGLL